MIKRVMIVDDDIVVRHGIRCALPWEKYGFFIDQEASNGKQALELIRQRAPDILVTDVKMPVCDGLQLCAKASELIPNLPMIILSGYEDFEYAKQAIHLGVKEYIVKPVEVDVLLEVLQTVTKRKTNSIDECTSITRLILGASILQNRIIRNAIHVVEKRYMEQFAMGEVAAELGLSKSYFGRQFKNKAGMSFIEFVNRYRIECAKELLGNPDLKGNDIAEMVGYQSYKYFHENFVRYVGCSPQRFRDN
jgi:two-component system response regulator YesN